MEVKVSSLKRKGFATLLLVGLSLTLVACANNSGIEAVKSEGSGLTVLVNQTSDAGDSALLVGKLDINSSGCIGVLSDDGYHPVAFPSGTAFQESRLSIPGSDLIYQLGDLVVLTGGNGNVTVEMRKASGNCLDSSIGSIFFSSEAELNSATS